MGHFIFCWRFLRDGSFIVGRIKFTCQTLLRDWGQEVYSFLCVPLWEESD